MKSLHFEFAKVHKFVGKYKESLAGLILLNTLLFTLAACNEDFLGFVFSLLFLVVFAYSNFRVLKSLTNDAVFTQKLCKTTAKFVAITLLQFVILCVGFEFATMFFFATSLPTLLALVLAALALYVTSYLVMMYQGAFVQIFANKTPFLKALANPSAPFATLGNKEKSTVLVISAFTLFVIFLLFSWSTTVVAILVLFILANLTQALTTAMAFYLNEATTEEVATQRAQDTSNTNGCACTSKEFVKQFCCSTDCARFFDPANLGKGLCKVCSFFFMAVAGVFQTVYAIIDDIKESSSLCRAEKCAKKCAQKATEAETTEQDQATATTATTVATVATEETTNTNPDTLENARYTENPGKPNTTDTLAEEFKTTDESDEAYQAKEARDEAKDQEARDADSFPDAPFKTLAEEQTEATQALTEADKLAQEVTTEQDLKVSQESIVTAEAAMSAPGTSAQEQALESGEVVSSSESAMNQIRDGIDVAEFPEEVAERAVNAKEADFEVTEELESLAPQSHDSVLDDPKFQQAPEVSKESEEEVTFEDYKDSAEALKYQDYQDYLDAEKDNGTDMEVPKKSNK